LEEQEKKPRPRPRIESLSDLIFGLALSIGAFALVSNPPTTDAELYRDIVTFSFNFVILISIWIRYTRIMSALPITNARIVMLNTILLFTVSIEPFLFNILRLSNSSTPALDRLLEAASSLYGIDLGALMLIMAFFTLALADEEKQLVPKDMIHQLRVEAATWLVAAGIFLASAVPLFGKIDIAGVLTYGLSIRIMMWLIAVVVIWASRSARNSVEDPPV
jgi:uncharacterized membrane protein